MYFSEKRLKAVKLYIKYNKSWVSVFGEFGYPPSRNALNQWYKEHTLNRD